MLIGDVLPAATRATARIASVVDVKQVGRELDVRYVLEGNVRKQAKKAEHA